MEILRDNYALAIAGNALGYHFVPCAPGTKVPLVKWKKYQTERPTADLYARWFRGTRNNIALVTTGLVIFDVDDPAEVDHVLRECGDTPHRVRTPRGGIHLGYRRQIGALLRNRVRVKGLPIDLRTDGGLEVIPNSRTDAGSYSWLGKGLSPISNLPIARVEWTQERPRLRRPTPSDVPSYFVSHEGSIRFPERYCLRIQSIQGQNGSRALVRVVCVLRDAGRTAQQIFDFVKHVWGPACAVPEWSDREVAYCIRRHCLLRRPETGTRPDRH